MATLLTFSLIERCNLLSEIKSVKFSSKPWDSFWYVCPVQWSVLLAFDYNCNGPTWTCNHSFSTNFNCGLAGKTSVGTWKKSDGANTSNILSNLSQNECILFTKKKSHHSTWLVGDCHQNFKIFFSLLREGFSRVEIKLK